MTRIFKYPFLFVLFLSSTTLLLISGSHDLSQISNDANISKPSPPGFPNLFLQKGNSETCKGCNMEFLILHDQVTCDWSHQEKQIQIHAPVCGCPLTNRGPSYGECDLCQKTNEPGDRTMPPVAFKSMDNCPSCRYFKFKYTRYSEPCSFCTSSDQQSIFVMCACPTKEKPALPTKKCGSELQQQEDIKRKKNKGVADSDDEDISDGPGDHAIQSFPFAMEDLDQSDKNIFYDWEHGIAHDFGNGVSYNLETMIPYPMNQMIAHQQRGSGESSSGSHV